ncbi:MAG TPA: hypothetical protein VJ994_11235 [Paracoccaceae bacterium]|nr:hypothetical protein [Paracoccaceae bacterium]
MPAPLVAAPAALKAVGYAAAGAATLWAIARARRAAGPRPDAEEAALDALPQGLDVTYGPEAGRARSDLRGRWTRVLRLGPHGPGVAVDLAAMARLRVASVPPRGGAGRGSR